jgi:hypothetical protein
MKRARPNSERRLCASCGARPALYRYHGQVKHDRTHVLCFQCYRAVRDSQRLAHPPTFPLRAKSAGGVAARKRTLTGTND